MEIAVDLHSHSGYAGGVGQIELETVSQTMRKKGIELFGTGDCLYPPRTKELRASLTETSAGLFSLPRDNKKFLLQTEVIFSTKLSDYKHKTIAHHLIFFPDFASVHKMSDLLKKWKMKNTIGRPFIVSNSQQQLEHQLFAIQAIHPDIEIIPAHVMTPDGILGSKNNLQSMKQFYGNFLPNIHAIETGLSADPEMLEKIPDLAAMTMISNSDCHSAALNRIGREFTVLEIENYDYKSIISSLRNNRVKYTAEFNPAEGRYYLTGHKASRKNHNRKIIFTDNNLPEDMKCPICHKKINPGVKERCKILTDDSIKPLERKFCHLIPLIEVIAHSLGIKSVKAKKVISVFHQIMENFSSEIELWQSDKIEVLLDKRVPQETINQILAVQKGDFWFEPPGYDGIYGKLKIKK